MKIIIETVPPDQIRNDEAGDWEFGDDWELHIKVASMSWKSALAVAVHEAIEARLCAEAGVSDLQVTQWDQVFNAKRIAETVPPNAECGDDPEAPYHTQHQAATFAERAVVAALGIRSWADHENEVEQALKQGTVPPAPKSS